jgi:hypothetical protein
VQGQINLIAADARDFHGEAFLQVLIGEAQNLHADGPIST